MKITKFYLLMITLKIRTLENNIGFSQKDRRVKAIKFSRNFGSHNAIYCGLMHAKGDGVVTIAADMQDPPEMIHKLWGKWQKGLMLYGQLEIKDLVKVF